MQFRVLVAFAVILSLLTMYATIAGFINAQAAFFGPENAVMVDIGGVSS